jgi:hypothetical protein
MLSVKQRIAARGCRETASGNFLNRTAGYYRSPMAGKLRHVCIDPEQLNYIEPFIRLCGNSFAKQLRLVTD